MMEGMVLLMALVVLGIILKAIHSEHGPQDNGNH